MLNRHSGLAAAVICSFWLSFGAAPPSKEAGFYSWAARPPLGWNSYDAFGESVTEQEVRINAVYVRDHLASHGWKYVVIDYRWYSVEPISPKQLAMDEFGRLLPATNRFPSATDGRGFKKLADDLHAMGLKFGIHVMRGIPRAAVRANSPIAGTQYRAADAADTNSTCRWNSDMYGVDASKPAGQAYYDSIFRLYADWGVDFVKGDNLSNPYSDGEIQAMRQAIDKCGRPIVLSTSSGPVQVEKAAHAISNANMWRISSDFWDNWTALYSQFERLNLWSPYRGPGHWPDADMIPIGRIAHRCADAGGSPRNTYFTRDEQLTLMTLWTIARSPLMLGMNMPENDTWTQSLITNDEVLAVNQQSENNRQIFRANGIVVWAAEIPRSKDRYLAVFNTRDSLDLSRAAFKSSIVTTNTPTQSVAVEVDVEGATKLYLLVTDGSENLWFNKAVWIEPRLTGTNGEIKLTELKWVSATSGLGSVGIGRGAYGDELVVDSKKVTVGIGTYEPSLIEYDLPPGYQKFQARGGLDQGGLKHLEQAGIRFVVFTTNPQNSSADSHIVISFKDLGFSRANSVRDLWKQKDLGEVVELFNPEVPVHGAGLYRLSPKN